jgi:hypothetical protein
MLLRICIVSLELGVVDRSGAEEEEEAEDMEAECETTRGEGEEAEDIVLEL